MKTHEIKSDATAGNSKPVASDAAKLLYNIKEAAARLSVSVVSLRKLIRQRRIKKIGGFRKILISENELQRFATCE